MAKLLMQGRKNVYKILFLTLAVACLAGLSGSLIYYVTLAKSTDINLVNKSGETQSIDNRLYTPTIFSKIENEYFIVDCWHNRVLYSEDKFLPIEQWQRLDVDLAGPHSVVKFGKFIVTEDTGRNKIHFYDKNGGGLYKIPHS